MNLKILSSKIVAKPAIHHMKKAYWRTNGKFKYNHKGKAVARLIVDVEIKIEYDKSIKNHDMLMLPKFGNFIVIGVDTDKEQPSITLKCPRLKILKDLSLNFVDGECTEVFLIGRMFSEGSRF